MTRILMLMILLVGCPRGDGDAVTIVPDPVVMLPDVPSDPFGTPGLAYDRLREVTDEARKLIWNGKVDDLSAWLESETTAVERSLGLMKTLRLGDMDVYAIANGRIALVYEHIAATLTEAEVVVKDVDLDWDWIGQESLLWEQANGFWARCSRGCSLGGPYLDVWELRCQEGMKETAAKLAPSDD